MIAVEKMIQFQFNQFNISINLTLPCSHTKAFSPINFTNGVNFETLIGIINNVNIDINDGIKNKLTDQT
jgi:hypothetical protein